MVPPGRPVVDTTEYIDITTVQTVLDIAAPNNFLSTTYHVVFPSDNFTSTNVQKKTQIV